MKHEFDSSRTCNYCGRAAEKIAEETGGTPENQACPARTAYSAPPRAGAVPVQVAWDRDRWAYYFDHNGMRYYMRFVDGKAGEQPQHRDVANAVKLIINGQLWAEKAD